MAGFGFLKNNGSGTSINWKNISKAAKDGANITFNVVMPYTHSTMVNSSTTMREVRMAARTQRIATRAQRNLSNAARQENRKAMDVFMSAFRDIEKGEYTVDRINDGLYNIYTNDIKKSFEMPTGDKADGISNEQIALMGHQGVAEAVIESGTNQLRGMNQISAQLISSNARNMQAMSRSVNAAISQNMSMLSNTLYMTNSKIDAVNVQLNHLITFHNTNTIRFYQTTIGMMNGLGKMMENLSMTMTPKTKGERRFDTSGGFDLKGYFNYVKQGLLETLVGSTAATANQIGVGVLKSPKGLIPTLLESFLPKSISKVFTTLDRNFSRMTNELLESLADHLDRNPLFASLGLGGIFGNRRRKLTDINMAEYSKDALPWNGLAQKALTEVIPDHLSAIEAGITGMEKRFYDYNSGKFMNESKIRERYEKENLDRFRIALNEPLEKLNAAIAASGRGTQDQDRLMLEIANLLSDQISGSHNGKAVDTKTVRAQMVSKMNEFGLDTSSIQEFVKESMDAIRTTMEQTAELNAQVSQTMNVYRFINNKDGQNISKDIRKKFADHQVDLRKSSRIGNAAVYIRTVLNRLGLTEYPVHENPELQNLVLMNAYFDATDSDLEKIIREFYATESAKGLPKKLLFGDQSQPIDPNDRSLKAKISRAGRKVINTIDDLTPRAQRVTDTINTATYDLAYGDRMDRLLDGLESLIKKFPIIGNMFTETKNVPNPYNEPPLGSGRTGIHSSVHVAPTFNPRKRVIGYGPEEPSKKASSYATRKVTSGISEKDQENVETLERLANTSTNKVLDQSEARRIQNDLIMARSMESMEQRNPETTLQGSIIQSNNMTRAAMATMVASFKNFGAYMFGKDGWVSKLWNSDARKKITGRLFTDEDAIFGDQYRAVKEWTSNVWKDTKEKLGAGYDYVRESALKYKYGENYEANEAYQNSRFWSQWTNRKWHRQRKEERAKEREERELKTRKHVLVIYELTTPQDASPANLAGISQSRRNYFLVKNGEKNEARIKEYVQLKYNGNVISIYDLTEDDFGKMASEGILVLDIRKMNVREIVDNVAEALKQSEEDSVKSSVHNPQVPGQTQLQVTDQPTRRSSVHMSEQDFKKKLKEIREAAYRAQINNLDSSDYHRQMAELVNSYRRKSQHTPVSPPMGNLQATNEKQLMVINQSLATVNEDIKAMGEALVGRLDESPEKKKRNFITEYASKLKGILPKTLAAGIVGAGVGLLNSKFSLLGSMFLPGGPISGAIVGAGLSILSQTEAFKTFMFGKLNPETQKREGGLISEKLRESMKKAMPAVIGGAAVGMVHGVIRGALGYGNNGLGVMGLQLLPGGILGSAMIGAGLGLLKHSDKFKELLFGKKDENGKRSGKLLSNSFNKFKTGMSHAVPYLKKGLTGAGVGALTGAVLSNMGYLPAMLSMGGPVGMGVVGLGLGIASATKRFNEWMFGTQKLDENGKPTGERNKDGILSRTLNLLKINMIEPIAITFKEKILDLVDWTRDKITYPFRLAFGPIIDSIHGIKDNVVEFVKDKFDAIGSGIMGMFKKFFDAMFKPITKLVGWVGKSIAGVASTGAKLALSPLSMGLRGLQLLTAGKRRKEMKNMRRAYRQSGVIQEGLQAKWELDEQEGHKRNWAGRMADRVGAWLGQGEIYDAFANGYEEQGGYNDAEDDFGQNHLGWREVLTGERRKARKQSRARKKEETRWREVDKLRRKLGNTLGGREGKLTTEVFNKYKDRFVRAGISEDLLQTNEDMMKLLYNREIFKSNMEGQSLSLELDKSQMAADTATIKDYLKIIAERGYKLGEKDVEEKIAKKEEDDWKRDTKKLNKILDKYGIKGIDTHDPRLMDWKISELTRSDIRYMKNTMGKKVSVEDFIDFMYRNGITQISAQDTPSMKYKPKTDPLEDTPDANGPVQDQPVPPKSKKDKDGTTSEEERRPWYQRAAGKFRSVKSAFGFRIKRSSHEPNESEKDTEPDVFTIDELNEQLKHIEDALKEGQESSASIPNIPSNNDELIKSVLKMTADLNLRHGQPSAQEGTVTGVDLTSGMDTLNEYLSRIEADLGIKSKESEEAPSNEQDGSWTDRIGSVMSGVASQLGFKGNFMEELLKIQREMLSVNKEQVEATEDLGEMQINSETDGEAGRETIKGNKGFGLSSLINRFKRRRKRKEEREAAEAEETERARALHDAGTGEDGEKKGFFARLRERFSKKDESGEKKPSLFSKAKSFFKNIFSTGGSIFGKLGKFAVNALKIGGAISGIATIGFTMAELISPGCTDGLSKKIKESIHQLEDTKNGPLGILGTLSKKIEDYWDKKAEPWISSKKTNIITWFTQKAWPWIRDEAIPAIGNFVFETLPQTAAKIGEFIGKNAKLLAETTIKVTKELIGPMATLVWEFTKGLAGEILNAVLEKIDFLGLFHDSSKPEISSETYGSFEEAQASASEKFGPTEVIDNGDGTYTVNNTKNKGKRTAMDENGNTQYIADNNGIKYVVGNGIKYAVSNSGKRALMRSGMKIGATLPMQAVKYGAKLVSAVPGPVGTVGRFGVGVATKIGNGAAKIGGYAKKMLGIKGAEKAAKVAAETTAEKVAENVAKKGAESVGKEVVESTAVKTIRRILSGWKESLDSLVDNGLIKRVLSNYGAGEGAGFIRKKIIKPILQMLDKVLTAPAKFASKIAAALEAGVAKITGKTAAGAFSFGITELVFIGGGFIVGGIDAANLFGVPSDVVNLKMRLVSALFGALSGTAWVGVILDTLCIIFDIINGGNLKRDLATSIYMLIASDEESQEFKVGQNQMENERRVYNALHNTNLSYDAYTDIREKGLGTKILDTGKSIINGITGLFGWTPFDDPLNSDDAEGAYQKLLNSGKTADQISKMSSAELQSSLKALGYGSVISLSNPLDAQMDSGIAKWKESARFDRTKRLDMDVFKSPDSKEKASLEMLSSIQYYVQSIAKMIKSYGNLMLNHNGISVGYGDPNNEGYYRQGNYSNRIGTFGNGKPSSMRQGGCGPTALSYVRNKLLGYGPISPGEIGDYAAHNGYISQGGANAGLFTEGAANLGLSGTQLNDVNDLHSSLLSGRPAILSGVSSGSSDPYTSAGHIVVADGVVGNKASIMDPISGRHSLYDLNSVASKTTNAWSYSPIGYGSINDPNTFTTSTAGVINQDNTKVYYTSTGNRVKKTLSKGTKVKIQGKDPSGKMYQIGTTDWVEADHVSVTTAMTSPTTQQTIAAPSLYSTTNSGVTKTQGVINRDNVLMYKDSNSNTKAGHIRKGATVGIFDEKNNRYQIGSNKWVPKDAVDLVSNSSFSMVTPDPFYTLEFGMMETGIINKDGAEVRATATIIGSVIDVLKKGTSVTILQEVGDFYQIDRDKYVWKRDVDVNANSPVTSPYSPLKPLLMMTTPEQRSSMRAEEAKQKQELIERQNKVTDLLGEYTMSQGSTAHYGAWRNWYYSSSKRVETSKGRYHAGQDMYLTNGGRGSAIKSFTTGEVVRVQNNTGGRGYYVIVRDNAGFYHIYQHLNRKSDLSVGDQVQIGQKVGEEGSSDGGNNSGPLHLHYEIRTPYAGEKYNITGTYGGDGYIRKEGELKALTVNPINYVRSYAQGDIDPNGIYTGDIVDGPGTTQDNSFGLFGNLASDLFDPNSRAGSFFAGLAHLGKGLWDAFKIAFGFSPSLFGFGNNENKEANDKISGDIDTSDDGSKHLDIVTGKDNEDTIWKTLRNAGYSKEGTAGLMGNLYAESALIPNNVQGSYTKKNQAQYNADYTAKVDNGSISEYDFMNNGPGGGGYGLAQWTYYTRKGELLGYTKRKNKSIGDLDSQLEFLVYELGKYGLTKDLQGAKNVRSASDIILTKYEQPKIQNEAEKRRRANFGQQYYDKFGKATIEAVRTGNNNNLTLTGMGKGDGHHLDSPLTFERSRKLIEHPTNFHVDPKDFKALGFGPGMSVDVDSGSTDSRLDKIFGLMAEWFAENQKTAAASSAQTKAAQSVTNVNLTRNETNFQQNNSTIRDQVRSEPYKRSLVTQHSQLAYRANYKH